MKLSYPVQMRRVPIHPLEFFVRIATRCGRGVRSPKSAANPCDRNIRVLGVPWSDSTEVLGGGHRSSGAKLSEARSKYSQTWVLLGMGLSLVVSACASQSQTKIVRYLGGERRVGAIVPPQSYEAYVRGELYFAKQQYDKAIVAFRSAMDTGPSDPYLASRLVRALYFAGQPNEANDLLRRSLKTYPNSESLWTVRAQIAEKEGNFYQAVSALVQAEYAAGNQSDASFSLVNALKKNGLPQRAAALRQTQLRLSDNPRLSALREDIVYAAQRYDVAQAERAAAQFLFIAPSQADEVREIARQAYEREAFVVAARLLDQVSRAVPDEVLRVQALIAAKQKRRALAILETSSPDRFGGELAMARLYLALDKPSRVIELCGVALAAEMDASEAHFLRGLALHRQGMHAQSVRELALVATGSSSYAASRIELTQALRRLGLEAEAMELLSVALEQNQNKSFELRVLLAFLLLERGRLAQALALFEQPPDLRHRVYRAFLLERGGDKPAALRIYLSVTPAQLVELPEEVALRVKAELAWSGGRIKIAQAYLRKLIEQDPTNLEARVRLQEFLFRQQDTDELEQLTKENLQIVYPLALQERMQKASAR